MITEEMLKDKAFAELYSAAYIGDKHRLWEALKVAHEFLPDDQKGEGNDYEAENPFNEDGTVRE